MAKSVFHIFTIVYTLLKYTSILVIGVMLPYKIKYQFKSKNAL